jgi:hypothetical protein
MYFASVQAHYRLTLALPVKNSRQNRRGDYEEQNALPSPWMKIYDL